jgi:hypothetical protein
VKVVKGSLEYLEKRREQIKYAEFQAMGYPIGSGAVESANKLVVEARLKGAGMHWAREHVNPMVALHNIVCSDRWEEAWPQISQRIRRKAKEQAAARRTKPNQEQPKVELATSSRVDAAPISRDIVIPRPGPTQNRQTPRANSFAPGRRPPAANHPWRRMAVGRNGSLKPDQLASAKL